MKTLGILGGMSWESTLVYYRLVNQGVAARLGGLHSAKLLLHSVDFAEVAALQRDGRWAEAGAPILRTSSRSSGAPSARATSAATGTPPRGSASTTTGFGKCISASRRASTRPASVRSAKALPFMPNPGHAGGW